MQTVYIVMNDSYMEPVGASLTIDGRNRLIARALAEYDYTEEEIQEAIHDGMSEFISWHTAQLIEE